MPRVSGAAFGLACSVKLIPLIFAPAILLCLPGLRPRLKWLAASARRLGRSFAALSGPGTRADSEKHARIQRRHRPVGLQSDSLSSTYDPAAKWIALLAASCLPLILKQAAVRAMRADRLLVSVSLAWLRPPVSCVDRAMDGDCFHRRAMIAWHMIAGIAALAVYAAASENTSAGVYADLLNPAHFPVLILMGIVCWIAIGANMAILWAGRSPVLPATPGDPGSIAAAPHC